MRAPWLTRLLHRFPLGAKLKLGPEDRIGIAVADRLREWSLTGRLTAIWWHTANEVGGGRGKSSEIAYAIAKALGAIGGTPDLVVIGRTADCALVVLLIELKAPAGRLTDNQVDFARWCALYAIPCHVARSVDEVERLLRESGVLR